jgi:hypothetical protein
MEATLRNMRAHYRPGIIAASPLTGEEASARPGDYFWLADMPDTPLIDRDGQPMLLAEKTEAGVQFVARWITTATIAELTAAGRSGEAVALAYAVLSERLGGMPDAGDQLYSSLFSVDECQALERVLALAQGALTV